MRSLNLFATLVFSAQAGVQYTASGIFDPTVPASFFTAPSQPWSITFNTDTNPAPISNTATEFTVPFTGFIYTLNGVNLGLTPSEIIFYAASEGGGFVVDITVIDQFSFTAPQMYIGSTGAPTMLYGTFVSVPHDLNYLMVDGNFVGSLEGTTIYATPEPGTVALAAGGILGLVAAHRRRRRLLDRN